MTKSMVYEELEPLESFEEFESAEEARRPARRPRPVFGSGAQSVSSATLHVPNRGTAQLTMPYPVATTDRVNMVAQALNANTQRINTLQARFVGADSSGPSNIFPLLIMMMLFPGLLSTGTSSSVLPLLFLFPGLLGGQQGSFLQPSTGTSSSGTPNVMMMFLMMIILKEVIK